MKTQLFDSQKLIKTNDLNVMHESAWELMQIGQQSAQSGMHQFFISTVDVFHNPQCRTIILRTVNKQKRELSFNTDQRSPKVLELQNNPNVVALLYDHQNRVQLRLTCTAILHFENNITKEAWANARTQSRLTYSGKKASGTKLSEPSFLSINEPNPSQELLNFCEQNFMVVTLQVSSLDMVFLHHISNKRIKADYSKNTELSWIEI